MIRTERGNIWDYHATHHVVIPTNIGYRRDGRNVMGRGLAAQAAKRFSALPRWYGEYCRTFGEGTPIVIYPEGRLILFPVKPLNKESPWLSWKASADLKLIERSAEQLARVVIEDPVAVSLVGCGNGGLDMSDVRPILDRHLSAKKFVLVLPAEAAERRRR